MPSTYSADRLKARPFGDGVVGDDDAREDRDHREHAGREGQQQTETEEAGEGGERAAGQQAGDAPDSSCRRRPPSGGVAAGWTSPCPAPGRAVFAGAATGKRHIEGVGLRRVADADVGAALADEGEREGRLAGGDGHGGRQFAR